MQTLTHPQLLRLCAVSAEQDDAMAELVYRLAMAEIARRQRATARRLRLTGAMEDFGPYLRQCRN